MISIRSRLVSMILSALLLGVALTSVLTFYYVHEEFSEVMDGSLKQLAISISPHAKNLNNLDVSDKTSLEEEDDFLIQVWENDELIYTSHPKIKIPLQADGFGKFFLGEEGLRYFQKTDDSRTIQIAHSLNERQEMEHDVRYMFIVPILLLLPVMVWIVYIVIGHGLKPLLVISHHMKERSAHNLSPIDIENIPQEIFPLIQSLNQLLRRLEDSVSLQRQFTADAAHELRTPLTAIKLQLDMLKRVENDEEREEVETNLKTGVDRTIDLVQSLLMLARHETDALAVGMEQINLVSVCKKIVKDLEPLAIDKSQNIHFENKADQVVKIDAQLHNISVMIENLLQNAILYTQSNGRIEVELNTDKKNAILSVADNGPGIKPEERLRVFDRFYRGQGTKKQGSGLGLSIIKNIVEYYHGSIAIENGLDGKGCKFIITFPLSHN